MADDGLLSWLGNALGGLGGTASPGTMPPMGGPGQPPMPQPPLPPVQQTGADQPPLPQPPGPQMGAPGLDPSNPTAPAPPTPPMPMGTDPMTAGGPTPNGPGLPPPGATPPEPPAAPPTSLAPPPAPPGAPLSLSPADANKIYDNYKAAGGGGPVTVAGGGNPNGFQAPPTGPAWAPDQQGRGGILSRALGLSPDQSNRLQAGIGAGFSAAGNSAGKTPFQALASGAGATMEGASKEQHQNTKDAQGYLAQAISAKAKGDEAAYKTNYMQYLSAKLKADQEKTASKDASNKNDTPTQLYLKAQERLAKDPYVKTAQKALEDAQKRGNGPTDPSVVAAQAEVQRVMKDREGTHMATLGLHPQTAAEIAKQPGMTQANPVDGKAQGLTKDNIGTKLKPGQFYTNPADGKVYVYKGSPEKSKSSTPAVTKPEPADPMKPERGTRASTKEPAMASADEED